MEQTYACFSTLVAELVRLRYTNQIKVDAPGCGTSVDGGLRPDANSKQWYDDTAWSLGLTGHKGPHIRVNPRCPKEDP